MKGNNSFWINLLSLVVSIFVFTVALINLITGKPRWVHNSDICIILASLTILMCTIDLILGRRKNKMEGRMIELTDLETQELNETGYTTHGEYLIMVDSDDNYHVYKEVNMYKETDENSSIRIYL